LSITGALVRKNIHFQTHVFRAIENGVPLVRAAASGLSAAVDPWGRVLGVSDFYAAADRTMTAQLPSASSAATKKQGTESRCSLSLDYYTWPVLSVEADS
jgi:predicted amidohydrolase